MSKKEKPPKPPKPPKKGKGKDAPDAIAADAEEAGIAKPGEEGAEGEAPAKKKLAGKTLVLFIVLPALLLLGGGGAAGYFLFLAKPAAHAEGGAEAGHEKPKKKKEAKGGGHGKEGEASAAITEGEGVYYYAMPEMLVNITSGDGRPVYLKLKLTLEAPDEDVAHAIEPELPRVTDQFQAFLRELRVDDLAGSAGAYRLRMELLRRVNLALAPAQINAVLIEEMLVQ